MSTSNAGRDSRIDFIRGLFILMMCSDHFEYLVAQVGSHARAKLYTYQNLGWSSGGEFFVFFSGYVVALAYSRTLAARGYALTQLRGAHRAWELYARNALVWALAMAMVLLLFGDPPDLLRATQIDRAALYPDHGIAAFMTLRYTPTFFEILVLYVVLMPLAPVYLWLHGRARFAGIGLSAALWLAVQLHPALNVHGDQGAWYFNPFAWQFVFFLGMWFARERPLTAFPRDRRARRIGAVAAVLVLVLVLKAMDKGDVVVPGLGALDIPGIGKTDVEPLRLAHFLLVIYLVGLAMPPSDWVRRHRLARAVALVGTHSLDCFCFSILLGYATAGLFSQGDRGTLAYFVLVLANLLGVVLAAGWFGWLKTPPWKPLER